MEPRKLDCNECGVEACDIMRSQYPKFRDRPSYKQQRVIEGGCRAWMARTDLGKKLGYLSDARHNLGKKS